MKTINFKTEDLDSVNLLLKTFVLLFSNKYVQIGNPIRLDYIKEKEEKDFDLLRFTLNFIFKFPIKILYFCSEFTPKSITKEETNKLNELSSSLREISKKKKKVFLNSKIKKNFWMLTCKKFARCSFFWPTAKFKNSILIFIRID